MNLTKPSVEAALRASIKKQDKGFTARDMQKAWAPLSIRAAQARIKKLVAEGVYECVGLAPVPDVMGRNNYSPLYRVVKREKNT